MRPAAPGAKTRLIVYPMLLPLVFTKLREGATA